MKLSSLFGGKSGKAGCSAVIVAAGFSQRMGRDKLFCELGGLPVLARTLRSFQTSELIDEIILVTREDSLEKVSALCREHGIDKVTRVVTGGSDRLHSSLIGASYVTAESKYIVIHDGDRPLVSEELIRRCVLAAKEYGAAVPVVPCVDTMKVVNADNFVTGTLERQNTYRVQTPQVFEATFLKAALTNAAKKNLPITDDAAAMEAMSAPIFAVAGDEDNIKITVPRDLAIAEVLLRMRESV